MYHEDDREGKPWWSHGAVRKDVWADLAPTADNHNDASTKDRLLALVAGIALVWRDATALPRLGVAADESTLEDRLHRCVLSQATSLLSDKKHTVALGLGSPGTLHYAYRAEVFLLTQCQSVWSALAQAKPRGVADASLPTSDGHEGVAHNDAAVEANAMLLHQLCDTLVAARWGHWVGLRGGHPANTPFASTPFVAAVAHAFGFQPTSVSTDAEVTILFKRVHGIFPSMLQRVTDHALASVHAVVVEVERCRAGQDGAVMAAAVHHDLHPLLAHLADTLQHDALLLFTACPHPASVTGALRQVVEALVALICALSATALQPPSPQTVVKDVCGFVQRLQGLIALGCPTGPAASSGNAASALGALYTAAILSDAAVPPSPKTLKHVLQQQPCSAADDPALAKARTAAMEALVLSSNVGVAHSAVLSAYLEASPALFFHSMFETVTKPVHAVHRLDMEPMLSIKDEDGKAFLLDIQQQQQQPSEGDASTSKRRNIVNVEGFMAFYFPRQWRAYAAIEAFVHEAVLSKASSEAEGAWALQALVAAAELAMECHAQESGAPVALDHLGCMWLLSTMAVQGIACAQPSTASAAAPWTVASKFPLMYPIAAAMFPQPSPRVGTTVNEPQLPSLSVMHKLVVVLGATNLFGFFLPSFRALGVEYAAIREDTEAYTCLAPDPAQLHMAALGMSRRPMLSFLQFDQLSVVGGSFLSPAVAPYTHAMHFLARIVVGHEAAGGNEARRWFVEMVAEAALLVAMYEARVDSVAQRVSLIDIDCASALFFAVLRFARMHVGDPAIDDIVPYSARTALVGDVFERLRSVALPTNLSAERKKMVRSYWTECMAMTEPFALPVVAEEVEAVGADAIATAQPLPGQPASVASTSAAEEANEATAAAPTEVDKPAGRGASPSVLIDETEAADPTVAPDQAPSTQEPAPSDAEPCAAQATPVEAPAPQPASPSPPTKRLPPNAHHNVWVSWFWSLRYADVCHPGRMAEAHKMLLRSLAATKGVPTVAIQRLRVFVRDEEASLKARTDDARAMHERALRALLTPPAVLATQVPVMRALVVQMMKELLLRASISVPDAMVSFAVLEQLLQHLTADAAPSTTVATPSDAATTESDNQQPRVRLPPLLVADALQTLIRGSNAHMCYASKTGTRGLAFFLGELVTKVLLAIRRAAVKPSAKGGAEPSSSSATSVGTKASDAASLPVAPYGILLPRTQDTSLLQDVCMETARTMERLLQASTPRGDVTACLVKGLSLPWLGLYERVAKRIKECEVERLRAFEDGSAPSGHPLRHLQKMAWVFPIDQPYPVTDVRFLFAPGGGGGAAARVGNNAVKGTNVQRADDKQTDGKKRSRDREDHRQGGRERSSSRKRDHSRERKSHRGERSGRHGRR